MRPLRRYGQNFLIQPALASRIADSLKIAGDDEVWEIGPGSGFLTERLIARNPARLVAVEIDPSLAQGLAQRFKDARVEILNVDFLKLDLPSHTQHSALKVVGNLPFNAATAILRRLADYRTLIERMVLMFQREVGERIRATVGTAAYSALSVLSQTVWIIDDCFRVGSGNFRPRPHVEAEVLIMRPRRTGLLNPSDERLFEALVRAAFRSPRKMLRNSLAAGLGWKRTAVERLLEHAEIESDRRPESLSVAEYQRIFRLARNLLQVSEGSQTSNARAAGG